MKTIRLMPVNDRVKRYAEYGLILTIAILGWTILPGLLLQADNTTGIVDQGIWLLILLAMISFLLLVALSWWLLQRFWIGIGLPGLGSMVLQFKKLELWQQLAFWLASFVSLLLAAVGALVAVL